MRYGNSREFTPYFTDAQSVTQGGVFDTEDGQTTFTDGQGNKYWFVDTTGGNVAITLPAATDVAADRVYTVKRTTAGANTLTVTPLAGNIDGAASHSITTQYAAYSYISDGSNYWII